MDIRDLAELIKTRVVWIQGLNGSGKTRLCKALSKYFVNPVCINDVYEDFNEYYDLDDIDNTGSNDLVIIDDFDSLFDKRDWNTKGNRELLKKINKRIITLRHKTAEHIPQSLVLVSRYSEIPSTIERKIQITVFCDSLFNETFIYDVIFTGNHNYETMYCDTTELPLTNI